MDSLGHGRFIIQINDFQMFIEQMMNLSNAGNKSRFIYRGHRQSQWKLLSTFARSGKSESDLEKHRQNFIEAIAGRRGINPERLDDNKLWALGQHFGLKTPFLDWSTSPYVALFFAFAEPNENKYSGNRTVFALNVKRLDESHVKKDNPSTGLEVIKEISDENHRMRSQGGLFTRIKPLEMDIETWIINNFPMEYLHSTIIRFEFDENLREGILRQLDWMNVNYLSLFPDIHGSALHVNIKLEVPDY